MFRLAAILFSGISDSVTPAPCALSSLFISFLKSSRDLMVLLGTNSTSAFGLCKGPGSGFNIGATNLTLGNIFFKLCKACQQKTMASIPPSAFSAGRIRQTQQDKRDMKLTNTVKKSEPGKFFNTSLMELSPLKYNSKLMNSIWGLYNRYSPHNVKKINDAIPPAAGEFQQLPVISGNKNENLITLPSAKLDNMWAAMNVSQ